MIEVEAVAPKILVIDDEERIRDACKMVLEDEGYQVAMADNGGLGLKMIEEQHFDVILLDLMMPEISGLEVLPKLRELHPDTAVIVITGYATVEHSIEAMKKGAFDFIPKPFTPEQLRAIVAKSIKYTRALQDFSDTKSRLRGMVNRLNDGVMTTDSQKKIVLANPAFLHMTGYVGESVIGKTVEEIIDSEPVLKIIDDALTLPVESFVESCHEITLQDDSGDERILSACCSPFRDRTGKNLGTTTVLHDITAIKKMDRMKSDFVSMVSHEIRSPMNSLLAQIKIISDGLAGDVTEKQHQILGRASDKIHNLTNLVSELLDLARIEAGMVTQDTEEVQIDELLEEQVGFHRASAEQKNIEINLHVAGSLPTVSANLQSMEEVVTNLITNAIKYSPVGSEITVSASVENNYLSIKVSDTGFGIPEEDLAKVFTRFHRVKDHNTRTIHGTGLGLAIVKSIIDSHHGSIRVESILDHGTTFTVLLPLG